MENKNKLSREELYKKKDDFTMEVGSDNDLSGYNTLDSRVSSAMDDIKNYHAGGFSANKISEVFSNIFKK